MEQKNQSQQSQIQIKDGFAGGEYANAMQVGHIKEEFLLTFLNIVAPSGRVCAKIITSPGHIKRMITALEDNLKKYEEKFGPVEPSESPKGQIGF
ncbi:MAG TPA: DUF3467 domain-containing protein [bacterium]|nr:DUF3467 domain-containing protein [bacterium]HPN81077.1 DUF3467 domain-containing protein [bacterium]HPW39178.1 DUF3467 domain-containing protein [bacterium]